MSVTVEKIDNGYMVYGPKYGPGVAGPNYTINIPVIGTAREYFPTLELALESVRYVFDPQSKPVAKYEYSTTCPLAYAPISYDFGNDSPCVQCGERNAIHRGGPEWFCRVVKGAK